MPARGRAVANLCRKMVHQFNKFEPFADAVKDLPVPWQLTTTEQRYSASIEAYEIGSVSLGRVAFGPCQATYAENRSASDEQICLTLQVSGHQRFVWPDRVTEIFPGDLILWNNRHSMRLDNTAEGTSYNLWLPSKLAAQRTGDLISLTRNKLSHNTGLAEVLSANVKELFRQLDSIPDIARGSMVNTTIDLMLTGFMCDLNVKHANILQDDFIHKAKSIIEEFSDISLITPTVLANKLSISVRYMQLLFANSGQTFSGIISEIRVKRASDALSSPRFSSCTITEIAHIFGFCDASHFNRAFRRRYGTTPSQYRQQSLRYH
ncbi:MAG: hypothetical protein B7Z20_01950 [Sphingobium sp. 32-64-5]|nr:MAG: hypothetical protein B7Z20_01950 [Sphingobium sp. 32-64-5]